MTLGETLGQVQAGYGRAMLAIESTTGNVCAYCGLSPSYL